MSSLVTFMRNVQRSTKSPPWYILGVHIVTTIYFLCCYIMTYVATWIYVVCVAMKLSEKID